MVHQIQYVMLLSWTLEVARSAARLPIHFHLAEVEFNVVTAGNFPTRIGGHSSQYVQRNRYLTEALHTLLRQRSKKGASIYDDRTRGGEGGSRKSWQSKRGCVNFILWISAENGQGGMVVRNTKILQTSFMETPKREKEEEREASLSDTLWKSRYCSETVLVRLFTLGYIRPWAASKLCPESTVLIKP